MNSMQEEEGAIYFILLLLALWQCLIGLAGMKGNQTIILRSDGMATVQQLLPISEIKRKT